MNFVEVDKYSNGTVFRIKVDINRHKYTSLIDIFYSRFDRGELVHLT